MIQRNNELEQKTINKILARVLVKSYYSEKITPKMLEIIKDADKDNKVITDAPSPYLTLNGNNKRTEFVLHCPMYNINWRIECKGQKKYSGLAGRIDLELSYVANIKENLYCLILDEALYIPFVLAHIAKIIKEKNIENKVWFGSLEEFEAMLIKEVA